MPYIITVSEMAKHHIHEVFGIPDDKMRVIYNGIDTEIFSPLEGVKRLDDTILMVMSRDTAVKGLRFLLQALAELRKKWDLKLVVVGRTLGDGETEKLMDRLGVTSCVSFCDQIDTSELVKLYRTATLLAVPSTYEGFGLPAAEAMSCGSPVVSTTAGALPEVVGDAGILVPPADPGALAAAIGRCWMTRLNALNTAPWPGNASSRDSTGKARQSEQLMCIMRPSRKDMSQKYYSLDL